MAMRAPGLVFHLLRLLVQWVVVRQRRRGEKKDRRGHSLNAGARHSDIRERQLQSTHWLGSNSASGTNEDCWAVPTLVVFSPTQAWLAGNPSKVTSTRSWAGLSWLLFLLLVDAGL